MNKSIKLILISSFLIINSFFIYTKAEDPINIQELFPCSHSTSKTETLVSRIDVGQGPIGVVVNPVTNKIYVTNFIDDTVSVLDSIANTPLTTISVGKAPNSIALNSKTNKIYLSNQVDNTVTVIDGATDTVISTVSVGKKPIYVSLNEKTNKIYVSNQDSNTVSVIDGTSDKVLSDITVGSKPQGIGINTETNKLYIANTESNNISIIDGNSNTITKTLENIIETPTGIFVDEVKNIVYAFTLSGDNPLKKGVLYIINGSSDTVTKGIIIGSNGTDIAFHKASGKVYITHTFNSTIDGYNTKEDKLLCLITELFDPAGITINPKTNLIYVCEYSTSKIAVVKDTSIKDEKKPDEPKNPKVPTEPISGLLHDFEKAIAELNTIQSEIKNASKFTSPVATRINSAIKRLQKATKSSELNCKNQLQVGMQKLESVSPSLEIRSCTEIKTKRCISKNIVDEFISRLAEQKELIKSIAYTDDDGNSIPDICEKK